MDFGTAIKTVFSKYVTFTGRARPAEFWYWVLFTMSASIALSIIDAVIIGGGNQLFSPLFSIAVFLPSLAVAVRRLHDTDHSGWFYLLIFIPIIGWIILIVFYATEGTRGDNRFGPNPIDEPGDSGPMHKSSIPPVNGDLDA
ncbi:MAG: uncharacterized membrane protein YhaH (DUF805 family) [Halocynthiibacter sp.]|jgi:uncharacterized membrane protein YhaH (DUF805 family)